MIEAAQAAIEFARGRSRVELDRDRMLLFALVRAVELVGEAASRPSPEVRHAAPDVPRAAIVAMRNRLIHGYFNVDHEILWKTVTVELPPLVDRLRILLCGNEGDGTEQP